MAEPLVTACHSTPKGVSFSVLNHHIIPEDSLASLPFRFSNKVRVNPKTGCWEWTAARLSDGYGQFWLQGKHVSAHRFAWRALVSSIPEGMTLDHLCRVRYCVNPAHLEAVSLRENILRGESPSAQNARAARCPQGHPFDLFNTYFCPDGSRCCRTCQRERLRRWRIFRQERRRG